MKIMQPFSVLPARPLQRKYPGVRFALATLLLTISFSLFSQNKLVEKANEYYKLNQYTDAAALYDRALDEMAAKGRSGRSMLSVKTKLAWCYRMNNKMDRAETLYADIVSDGRARADTYLYYGEALMSNGKYEEAKKWFLAYQKLKPEDGKGALMAEACDKVPFIQPYFERLDVREFAHNSGADDNAPIAWQGGILFSSDRQSGGLKLVKEKSGWTGRDYLDLYFSEKLADGSFSEPRKFSGKLSSVNKNICNASIPADGSEIFFTRNDNELNKRETYNLQIYRAEASGGRWKNVEKLPFCSSAFNYMHPAISPSGQWLFFTADRRDGQGGTDLWVAKRNAAGWEKPENLGASVNTPANEGFPFVDAGGRLFFCSKGLPGFGGFDIFMTHKDGAGNWAPPVNLGKPINSSLDDISIYIAPAGRSGMFTSSRSGGDDDIYLFEVPEEGAEQPLAQREAPPGWEQVTAPATEPEVVQPPAIEEKVAETPPEETPVPVVEKEPEPVQQKTAVAEREPVAQPAQLPFFEKPEPEETAPKVTEKDEQAPPLASLEPEIIEIPPDSQTAARPKTPFGDKSRLPTLRDFEEKLALNQLYAGDRFVLEGAKYDANVWQPTPRIAMMLDRLEDILQRNPSLSIEIGVHTEASGIDEYNQKLSGNRAAIILEYMLRDGIPASRISAKGYGEAMPLNHCRNGVDCTPEEYLVNQRIEVKILGK
jgi:outer membrane protein OmpA-like peptidoglycan-associated protein/tetratricopeptide (TPR) repeat protein